MTKIVTKKISRRDALKILTAAAGAAALANLPSKWSKPGLEVGMLPAHAQTSIAPVFHTLVAGADQGPVSLCGPTNITSTVTISPATSGISMNYVITHSAQITINSPAVLTGTAPTDATGTASLTINAVTTGGGTITIVWSFANASDGTGSGTQVFTAGGC